MHGLFPQLIHIIFHQQTQCRTLTRMFTVIIAHRMDTVRMVLCQFRPFLFSQGTQWTEIVTATLQSTSDSRGHLSLVLAMTMVAGRVIIHSPGMLGSRATILSLPGSGVQHIRVTPLLSHQGSSLVPGIKATILSPQGLGAPASGVRT
jgi:hypothetical protein